ncbi:RILP (Rab7-Interacting Lysosomal Protein) [Trichostrongylus colubriformis]|uniref:RILP (Rab7-Interacting Lysosomal Protein) n=1 Tax=Trichostrongylus colubriformis TaxID=6319 RepID=A0AAN8EWJ6_TRICO
MMSLPLLTNYEVYVAEGCQKPYCNYHRRRMATVQRGASPQSPSKHITVVDVYDLAASIGKDFEKLIELHGNDCVRGIMPKVISALETLESLANNNERENEEILSLQKTVERLEHEKQARQLQTAKFEEELDQVEETYKKDINELRSMVKALMSENKTLSTTVSSLPANAESPTTAAMREEDVRLMFELKEMSHKQKEEIKALQRDVEQYACEVENLQNSIERLIRQNEELLRKNASLQKQGRMIVEEKMEIIRRLEKTEEANIQLRRMLSDTDRVCKDLQQANQFQVDDEPRFTLAELREVLQEKNVLKGRVMELEEELENLRPGRKERERDDLLSSLEDLTSTHPSAMSSKVMASDEPSRMGEESDEMLVYGPLPREPDEKLYPWKYERKDSGVRKFFRFFKEFGANPSPRRGSSTTSSPRPQRANAGN